MILLIFRLESSKKVIIPGGAPLTAENPRQGLRGAVWPATRVGWHAPPARSSQGLRCAVQRCPAAALARHISVTAGADPSLAELLGLAWVTCACHRNNADHQVRALQAEGLRRPGRQGIG